MKSSIRKFASAVIAVTLALAAMVTGSAPAHAVGNANIFWVGDDASWNQQLYSGSTAATPVTLNALTSGSSNNPNRGIASDGTYLYFSDSTTNELKRTDLHGNNPVTVANLTSGGADAIAVSGGYVYWASWSGGILGISANSIAGTPAVVVSPGASGRPSSGFSGIAVSGSHLYFSVYDGSNINTLTPGVGLYHANLAGLSASSITKNTDVTGFVGANPGGGLFSDGANVYMLSHDTGRIGVIKTSIWSQSISSWTLLDLSSVMSWPMGLAVLGSDIFVTDGGSGKLYAMTTAGASITEIYGGATVQDGYQIAAINPPSATVTFDVNGGSGSMTSQTAGSAMALTTNTLTRPGYTFSGWNTAANGSGTAYADGAQYAFAASATLYAQWVAVPASGGASVDSTIVRLGPVAQREVEPTATTITLTGFNLGKVTSVTINGEAAKFKLIDSGHLEIAPGKLELGACTLAVAGVDFAISMPSAFKVVENIAGSGSPSVTERTLAVYFAPGSSVLSAAAKSVLASKLAVLKKASGQIVITAWAQNTGNNRGDVILSAGRAKAIVNWLAARGVKASAASGKGTLDAAATSRRADVTYLTK